MPMYKFRWKWCKGVPLDTLVQKFSLPYPSLKIPKFCIIQCSFSFKKLPICRSHSSINVIHWIENIGTANPLVKWVSPQNKVSPIYLIKNFWKENSYISIMDEARDLQFGTHLHQTVIPNFIRQTQPLYNRGWVCQRHISWKHLEEKWVWPGARQAPQNLASPLKYLCNGWSHWSQASDFKFGMQFEFTKTHQQNTLVGNVGVARGSRSSQQFGVVVTTLMDFSISYSYWCTRR